jgi:hypothetical protein
MTDHIQYHGNLVMQAMQGGMHKNDEETNIC